VALKKVGDVQKAQEQSQRRLKSYNDSFAIFDRMAR